MERELEAHHRQMLRKAKMEGEHFAKTNRPRLRGDNLDPYVAMLVAPYDEMSARVQQSVGAENLQKETQMETDAAEEKNKALNENLEKTKTEKHKVEHEMDEKEMSLEELPYLAPKKEKVPIPLILAVVETFFGAAAFQILGDNLIIAIIISAGITFALILLAKFLVEQIIENTNDSRKKAMFAIGGAVVALAVFYLLAMLRAKQLSESTDFPIHPIFLVFVNILFFLVTCYYYYSIYRTKAQRKRYEELLRYQKILMELARQEAYLTEQIEGLKKSAVEKVRLMMSKPGYAKWLIERIRKWRVETIETFKAANLAHRSDKQTPDCFFTHIEFIN